MSQTKLNIADQGTVRTLNQMKSNYEQIVERIDTVEERKRVLQRQQDGFSGRAAAIMDRARLFTTCDCYLLGLTNDIYCPEHNPRKY